MIKADCPFFFEMKKLVAQRPNRTPTGLGNSSTAIESGIVLGGGESGAEDGGSDGEPEVDAGSEHDHGKGDENGNDGSDSDDGTPRAGRKQKVQPKDSTPEPSTTAKSQSGKKTSAHPNMSAPAPAASAESRSSKAKKFKGALNLEELAKAKEVTKQQELELAKERLTYSATKLKTKAEMKMQQQKHKFELRRLQLEQRKELALAQMRLSSDDMRQCSSQTPTPSSFYHSHSSPDVFQDPSFVSGPFSSHGAGSSISAVFDGAAANSWACGCIV